MLDHRKPVSALGLVLHPTKPVDTSLETIVATAAGGGVRVLAREIDRSRVPDGVEIVTDDEFTARVDVVVALGGDGTMLGALRLLIGRPVPVLGVNHGNLGFLVEVAPRQLPAALKRLSDRNFTIELYGAWRSAAKT